ncbi:MAG TPA: cyclase family protein [Holophagaceae bacterium]|nr:cyclase family protein [Holophagaceae bacterium]
MKIHDISPLISPRLAVWPGDVPFSRSVAVSMAEGANLDLSSMTATLHLGAHADAPSHYAADGAGMDAVNLMPYYGPCQVLRVAVERGERILPQHLRADIAAPRVLFHTGTFPDPEVWNTDFASLSPELIEHLHGKGVLLVGLDTPSVDPFESKALESHQALARTGMRNLEGLVLDAVPEGLYTLAALPLKIEGADASPVRAMLIEG